MGGNAGNVPLAGCKRVKNTDIMDLSIIIPMYNAGKYIGQCLESLVEQDISTDNYEIIVVNDGSSDDSEQVVLEYAMRYPQIKLFSKPNGGVSAARNYGMSVAHGDYIGFVDADDFVVPGVYGQLVDCVKNSGGGRF